ncbi:hypothetical protein [Gracilinema caldarium]|uniref:Uncharacterized protein n=1 Tax=Gracilinema caldarium (strain ATCC 51460 / DSM 7334 / H1) TaxID=744872 RepID=F8F2X8_GRAC1|nr:hypothetical protein [Gracilinema caldarium]AEJ19886.1 hypothetical protein Spica_1744 [Gracilinema caldarium DSM 7334]
MKEFILQIIASFGGAAVITGLAFSWFGKKIVERQIEKSAEKAKYKIEAEFDRISKIQSHEFTILPEIWIKLLNALGGLGYITNPVKEFPDIQRMSLEELSANLKLKDWPEHIKKEIIDSSDKNKAYILWAMKKSIFDTETLWNEFHNYYLINKIFLTEEMDVCLDKIDSLGLDSLATIKVAVGENRTDWKMLEDARKIVNEDLEIEKKNLSRFIQNRLHFHQVK